MLGGDAVTDEAEAGERSARRPASAHATLTTGELPMMDGGDGWVPVELRHIYKSFGGVRVLKDVSFKLSTGEVLGLVGDNGAGKSTVIKIITGVHQPDSGQILFRGEEVKALTVDRARALGVETVYQERALAEQLSLWRNIFMGRPISRALGFLHVRKMRRITADLMGESMGFTSTALTPDTHVTGLSGGERQGLAIVRALHFEADIIILDEPTMGLSLKETDKLLHFVKGIKTAGKSAIFIDHNIFHVYSVADRIVVLDRGQIAADFPTSRYSLEEVTEIMREVAATGSFVEPERHRAAEADEAGGAS
jgi:simple sugar transport system ATP-binding protein